MTIDDWHANEEMLHFYARGDGGIAVTASIEAHLMSCPECRARIALVSAQPLERSWERVAEQIHEPSPSPTVRLMRRAGLGESDSLLLSATRSLDGAWMLATLAVVLFAALAAIPSVTQGRALYLLVAPLVPVVGVVAAFRSADPLAAVVAAAPYAKARLALLRTIAVVITAVPLSMIVGGIVPGIAWLAFAWLLPALALTLGTLLAMTWWDPEPAGVMAAACWIAVIATAYASRDVAAIVQPAVQLVYVTIAAVAAAGLAARIAAARPPGGHA
jgi:anti-sigma factor RsiW